MILIIDKVYKKLLLSQIIAWTIVICTPFLFLNSFRVEIRQVLSIALLLYGFTFFHLEGSVKKFLFFAILASSSHFSSIFASLLILTIYLLIGRIKEKNMNIAIIMVMILYFFILIIPSTVFINIVSSFINAFSFISFVTKYSAYLESLEPLPIIKILIYTFMSILAALISIKVKDYSFKRLVLLFFLGNFVLIIFKDFAPMSRLFFYFSVLQLIIIPKIVKIVKPTTITVALIFLFYIIQFVYGLYYITPYGEYAFLPYKGLIMEVFK